jgi:hypothetical protein
VVFRSFKLVKFVKLELKNFKNEIFLGEFQLPEVGKKNHQIAIPI